MSSTKYIVLGVGVVAAAGIGYYLYTKNQGGGISPSQVAASSPASSPSIAPGSSTPVASSSTPVNIKQSLWKDADGNVFELKSTGEDKYGFPLLVNGQGNSKAITAQLDDTGHIVTTNKSNETWTYKGGKWSRLSGLKGLGFAMQPRGYAGLGNAFALNG